MRNRLTSLFPSSRTLPIDGNDRMKEMIQENYNRIRAEVRQIVADELQRIQSDPELQYLLQNK